MDNSGRVDQLAVVVLAAGRGERLRPLTDSVPKPLCLLGGQAMIDWVIGRLPFRDEQIAVNANYLADQVVDHFRLRNVRVEVEPRPLGSAGAIGNLLSWIDGRDTLIHNADAWLDGDLSALWRSPGGVNPRLLVQPAGRPSDFDDQQFVGASLLPWSEAVRLRANVGGLYDTIWAPAHREGRLELLQFAGKAIDCGTWPDYQRANDLATKKRKFA